MSKLPNAPLIEVIFELKWQPTQEDLKGYQYLIGDLYSLIKDEFPERETLIVFSPETPAPFPIMHLPMHKFSKEKGKYPLVQTGQGLLTVNTIDESYIWEDYRTAIIKNIDNLHTAAIKTTSFNNLTASLAYYDFFSFDFNKGDIIAFLKENLHIEVNQTFYSEKVPPIGCNIQLLYDYKDGKVSIAIQRGIAQNKEGIIIQTLVNSNIINFESSKISSWLDEAQQICSETFKNMTKGTLFDSFKLKKQ